VGGWPDSLAGEPEQSLKDRGASLTKLIAQGRAALDQRRKAVAARKDHRLPIDWPSRFFRRASRPKEEEAEVPAPPAQKPAPATTGA
jgi:hypothetical protein